MTNDKKNINHNITSNELEYILDVNRKVITVYNEVAQQNEAILEQLKKLDQLQDQLTTITTITNDIHINIDKKVEKKINNLDRTMFKIFVVLSAVGLEVLYTIIQSLFHH